MRRAHRPAAREQQDHAGEQGGGGHGDEGTTHLVLLDRWVGGIVPHLGQVPSNPDKLGTILLGVVGGSTRTGCWDADRGRWPTMLRGRGGSEQGSVAITVALALTLLLGLAALVVDVGLNWAARTSAQTAADSAALAGA